MNARSLGISVSLFASLALAAPAFAVDQLGLFELEGNALDDGVVVGDDWDTLYNGGGSAETFTGVNPDPAPASIFTGGRKDIQEISDWGHKDGSVPDKDDITDAYAAAYTYNGDLIVYFGADRLSNVGDAFLGFWFFKNLISTNPDGSFTGDHENGDTLILADWPQASNAVPEIAVLVWDDGCSKAANNNPQPGQCAAQNLRLIYGGTGAGAVCNPSVDPQPACAVANDELGPYDPTPSPWPYTSKDGFVNEFPYETFFEGGANLTDLLGGDACFASFMAETRSSSSFTASLKDFRLDSFPVCAISVTKACNNPVLNAAQTMITYDISGTVTNDGFGTVYNIGVSDSPAFDSGSLQWSGDPSSLAGGASIDYSATITVPLAQNGPMDMVTATANTQSDNGGTALTDTQTATCPALTVTPAASVSKSCSSIVTLLGDPATNVIAKVNYSGQVCNTGDSALSNVSVKETPLAGIPTEATHNLGSLAVGQCKPYSGSYTPNALFDVGMTPYAGNDPTAVWFHDSVEVSATDIFGGALTPKPTASAHCPLCECQGDGCQ